MADPASYRPAPGTIPTDPGVYKFRDAQQRVIYVGKAKNLRARLSNYFQDITQLHPRTRQMVLTAGSVEWTVVASEVEALQLEYTWIKKFDPRFNVMYRDDKSYPMLAVSVAEEFPRAFFYRGARRKGVRYFGPYGQAWAVRNTIETLTRVFPIRTCSQGVFNRHSLLGRPCLLGYIEKCSAPCVGRVTALQHRELVDGFLGFMTGKTDRVRKNLQQEMEEAAANLDFERAARLRDDIAGIDKLTEQQTVVLGDGTDADVIGIVADDLEAAVQIFHVREGRIKGQRSWVVEIHTDSLAEIVQDFLIQFYSDAVERAQQETAEDEQIVRRRGVDKELWESRRQATAIPREVLVPELPVDKQEVQQLLEGLRGSYVSVRVPQRGDKKALAQTVTLNAKDALKQHKMTRIGDITARSAALNDIQKALDMDEAPLRIECTDISHIQGTDVVASLVVFEDGLPKKADYRRYRIKEAAGEGHSNDVASIAEVTRRRFAHYHEDKAAAPALSDDEVETTFGDERLEEVLTGNKRFAYPPQLFIVDGGAPQVAAAQKVFDELGIGDVTLVGLAKRLEEVWIPDSEDPVILPRNSQALFLLQHIRDEAHRCAITYHRNQRSKRMKASVLDSIPGLGPARRRELVKHFGSVKRLKEASVEDIAEVTGFGPRLAETIFSHLHPEPSA